MKSQMHNNRREFLKSCGLLTAPLLIPSAGFASTKLSSPQKVEKTTNSQPVNFVWDGMFFPPADTFKN